MGVAPISVPNSLAAALASAGDKSGVDFEYLLQTAMRESSLNPEAKARTSSAVGLFQFLESTWLEVMKSEGPRLGYQSYADAIEERGGEYTIRDSTLRAEVLKLREDPQIAADLAAAFTKNNGAYLAEKFGRMPSPGELYIAHFLGARGASAFFAAGLKDPDQIASTLFPRQARANPSIFYKGGAPLTIKQVYRSLVAKHEAPAAGNAFAAQQLATERAPLASPAPLQIPSLSGGPDARWPAEVLPSRFTPDDMNFESMFSTSKANHPRTLLTESPPAPAEAGFFSSLYGK